MTRYRVGALVTGVIYDEIEAGNEEQAKEIMLEKYGDKSIPLCLQCANMVSGLAVSEDVDMYDTEELVVII